MKSILFISFFSAIFFIVKAQQTFTVSASGSSFSPATLNVTQGDIVRVETGSDHPVLQVSQATWNTNGSTPLQGGFSYPNGSGTYNVNSSETIYFICTVHIGSGMKGRILVSSTTNIETETITGSFSLLPNPANDFVNIVNNNNLPVKEIKIIDFSGKTRISLTESLPVREDYHIDIRHLNKGFYFIVIDLGNSTITRKLLKQ